MAFRHDGSPSKNIAIMKGTKGFMATHRRPLQRFSAHQSLNIAANVLLQANDDSAQPRSAVICDARDVQEVNLSCAILLCVTVHLAERYGRLARKSGMVAFERWSIEPNDHHSLPSTEPQ